MTRRFFLRWRYHLDRHGVSSLVNKMLNQGIGANAETLANPQQRRAGAGRRKGGERARYTS